MSHVTLAQGGHTIGNLTINLPATNYVGLFGVSSGTIGNIGMAGGSVTGLTYVGGLVGSNSGGSIGNSYATGSVRATNDYDGGLVGYNAGSISNSYATGYCNSGNTVGGLVGLNTGSISNSFATGVAFGNDPVGGLVGYNSGSISNSYATGKASGSFHDGGLVGFNSGSISNSYATGAVYGADIGGLVAFNYGGTVSNSYWDTQTSGQATSSAGGIGLTTAQMQNASSFTGWSIATTGASGDAWRIYQGETFPLLLSFMTPLTLANTTVTYSGSAKTGVVTGLSGIYGAPSSGINVGVYDTGYYSDQEGYDISGGALTINQLASVTWIGGTSGGWSKPSNWAGGAIPDYANVAAVTIPAGATVTYDSGVPGATTLSRLTSSGNLVMAAGDLSTTGNLTTAGYLQSGGTLDVGGTLTIKSTSGGVTLGDITAKTLSITSNAGAITQLAATSLEVTGATTLTADNGQTTGTVYYGITLADAGNQFVGPVTSTGSNIDLAQSKGRLILGNTTATGTFTGDSTGGAITQAASTAVNATGAALMANNGGAVNYAITLGNAGNNFLGGVTAQGGAITLEDAGALTALLDSSGPSTLTSAGNLEVSGTVGTTLKTTTTGTRATTTFGATTVGNSTAGSLVVTSANTNADAVSETSANILTVHGEGTTTTHDPYVKVNGIKGVEIPAP